MTVRAAVVVLAGGIGSRMQAGSNKVYLPVRDKEILAYCLETIDLSDLVEMVVLVIRPEDADNATRLLGESVQQRRTVVAHGGASRHASERAGLEAIASEIDDGTVNVVAVHDGARPFMSQELLERVLAEAHASGGAIPGSTVEDTLYSVDEQEFVDASDFVWSQTPQAFEARVLLAAHRRAGEEGYEAPDTAEVIEKFSEQAIKVVEGEPTNIKVTFRHDLPQANGYAEVWSDGSFVADETAGGEGP